MVTLEKIRREMEKLYEDDKARVFVEVSADTLDEAIANAAVELDVSVRNIDYEVIQRGVNGFFALTKKPWIIRAYQSVKKLSPEEQAAVEKEDAGEQEVEDVIPDRDGAAFVFFGTDGVYLKVVPPSGNGSPVTLKEVKSRLRDRNVHDADDDTVKTAVEKQSGNYIRVAHYDYNPANNPVMSVDITDQEMKAWLYVTPPGPGGADLSAAMIIAFLQNNRVTEGVDEERINAFVDSPVYKQQYLVAEGVKPKDGDNAYIEYNFEVDRTKVKLKETEGGKVDFKELNIIQNVVAGQVLAKKIPAKRGQGGKTVTGKYLEAKNGKDIPLPLGKYTRLAEDGVTILASLNGQVLVLNNKINVEPILNIEGDVSLKTGNIMFLGTVYINGSVEDGFTVKATGNIEVRGSVGKSNLDAEGDIVVGQGIVGKGEGIVHAGKSIWARFIENTKIEAGEFVIVSDGIINSQVSANKKILCNGKRAAIIGGTLTASEEIHAKTLGSLGGGSETVFSVGFDPHSKERLDELMLEKQKAEKELGEVQLNYTTLVNQKKQKAEFSEEKEESLKKLGERKYTLQDEIEEFSCEIDKIQDYLSNLKMRGKVSASAKVYAGVKIIIRDVVEEVRSDCKATTFYLENGLIRYGKYQGPDEDMKRVPNGYASN